MKKKIVALFLPLVIFSLTSLASAQTVQTPGLVPGQYPTNSANTSSGGWNIRNISGFGLPSKSIAAIITGLLKWLLMAFGVLGIIAFLIAGVLYLTSAGNDDQAKKAKNAMTYAIYGVIIGLAGFVIIQAINAALNAASF